MQPPRRQRSLTPAILFLTILMADAITFGADRPFGDNVELRGSLDNSRMLFLKEKKGTVAFLADQSPR
jgi:hypothetical protein